MSQTLKTSVAVIGVDIGKNSFPRLNPARGWGRVPGPPYCHARVCRWHR
jgi:hypothetical protein